ncbi:preprotein translocase subunit SecD [Aeromicrobium panaciterrae]|uniref:Protein translocase subunit SecD n=1 Tax=Aeromicrobium panaciterrae TaxID=363861 RepID=A0ABU1UNH0_9ACTN|nr:protein translocase subunit SecD [Aeromicrobium panaciterrae]MDR7086727.1 preprotein translocase subunit SecD [Aeromicrobium panaciterrae]
MAAPKTRSANLPRPKRTLTLFLAAVVAMFGLVALIDANGKKGDDSAWKPKLGLDLQGGTRITFEAKAEGGKVTPDKLKQARDIVDQRVNGTGVTEAEVTTQGGNQIIVEIPGQQRANIVDQVGKTAQLRFRLVWATGQSAASPTDTTKDQKIVDDLDWTKLSLDQLIKAETEGVATLPKEFQKGVTSLQKVLAGFICTKDLQVNDVSDKPLVTCDTSSGEVQLLSPTVIEGTQIKSADAVPPSQQNVEWVVALALKGQGKDAFDKITDALFQQTQAGNEAGSRFAIVLDGVTLSAPTSQFHSTDGRSQISGNFTSASSKDLANQLKYGALPLTFGVNGVSEEGPSLAGSQLHAGLIAGLVGMILVVLFLLFYYRGLGIVAIGSLLVSAIITYASVLILGKAVGFTLTLPGIAGLIVAIGITADSFIVFFERIRDEVREGKSLRLAVEAGWVRARATILAADGVSILAALVLFIFAIGVVRGFAFALGLTTVIDIFVVFLFTKPLVTLLARTKFFGQGHKLSGLDAAHLGISGRKVSELARTTSTAGKAN